MTIELDHFFVLTDHGAPQAELLSEIGLIEGTANSHPGQGTANRRFFFSNSMLELAYVRDANEAASGPGSHLRLGERAANAGASPFGLVLGGPPGSTNAPFPGWPYHPAYLEADQCFHIGQNSDLLEEPLCVWAPFELPGPTNQPLPTDPFTRISELRISVPVARPSSVLATIAQVERISLQLDEPHGMEVIFNEEEKGQFRDLRPRLPLIIRW